MVCCQAINHVVDPNFLLRAARQLMGRAGLDASQVDLWATVLVVSGSLLVAWLLYLLLTRAVIPAITRVVAMTRVSWDDIIFNRKILNVASELLVMILISMTVPRAMQLYPDWAKPVKVICDLLIVFSAVHLVNRLLIAVYNMLEHTHGQRVTSLKGIRQMLQVVAVAIGVIISISILAERDPLIIISGLGAAATVLMLVFKDPIMGVVAEYS